MRTLSMVYQRWFTEVKFSPQAIHISYCTKCSCSLCSAYTTIRHFAVRKQVNKAGSDFRLFFRTAVNPSNTIVFSTQPQKPIQIKTSPRGFSYPASGIRVYISLLERIFDPLNPQIKIPFILKTYAKKVVHFDVFTQRTFPFFFSFLRRAQTCPVLSVHLRLFIMAR